MLITLTIISMLLPVNVYADESNEAQPMYRLYNPNSGEHFYTASEVEKNNLKRLGWSYEGVGWVAPVTSSTPVYRLYNPNAGDHHYTMSVGERDSLMSVGWNDEGIGWYSDDSKSIPLYRQYNPNAVAGSHNYTTSVAERDSLISVGWNDEGVAWHAVKEGLAWQTTNANQNDQSVLTDKEARETEYVIDNKGNTVEVKVKAYCENTPNHRHIWVYTGGISTICHLWPDGTTTTSESPCKYCSACNQAG